MVARTQIITSQQRKLYRDGLPVSFFGKLPIYQDFVRIDRVTDGTGYFIDWLDHAFGYRWSDLDDRGETVAGLVRLLLVPESGPTCVIAAIRDSTDQGGLRRFPFAALVELPKRSINISSPGFIAGLTPVWSELEKLLDRTGDVGTISEFYDEFRNLALFPEVDEERALDLSASVTEFSSWLMESDAGQTLPEFMFRIAGTIAKQKKLENRKEMTLAYRLPCLPQTSEDIQAGVWVNLLGRSYAKLQTLPSLVLPRSGKQAGSAFGIVFRPLEIKDVRLLSDNSAQAERVFNLAATNGYLQVPPTDFTDRINKDLFDRPASLADLAHYKLPKVKLTRSVAEDH